MLQIYFDKHFCEWIVELSETNKYRTISPLTEFFRNPDPKFPGASWHPIRFGSLDDAVGFCRYLGFAFKVNVKLNLASGPNPSLSSDEIDYYFKRDTPVGNHLRYGYNEAKKFYENRL